MLEDGKEYIFEFGKVKHAQKALEVLIGSEKTQILIQKSSDEPKPQLCKQVRMDFFTNIGYYTQSWQQGVLSNGDYLLYLNFVAHRSFNDPTQYPIFPWLVSTNQQLNVDEPSCLRNLSKPIGALSQDKLE